ncbi:hypothetical protein PFISCL1PPCAC_12417, partial [Pristionchus fissidentatus]
EFLSRLADRCNVNATKISLESSLMSNPRQFLLDISGKVETVHITQCQVIRRLSDFHNVVGILFGVDISEWVDLTIEMYERGVEQIVLSSDMPTSHLSAEDVSRLFRIICARKLKVFFSTTTVAEPVFEQVDEY